MARAPACSRHTTVDLRPVFTKTTNSLDTAHDQANAEVVRMNVTFTRAALLDKALEDVSVVLENRLVGGRFWLPSRQEIEIRRNGEWLDYPVRGIIRGRW